jgi:hypothetical protein
LLQSSKKGLTAGQIGLKSALCIAAITLKEPPMNSDQIATAGKAGLDTFYAFASTQFAAIEKLTALNLSTAKTALDASLAQRKMCGI